MLYRACIKPWVPSPAPLQPETVAHSCNLSILKVETGSHYVAQSCLQLVPILLSQLSSPGLHRSGHHSRTTGPFSNVSTFRGTMCNLPASLSNCSLTFPFLAVHHLLQPTHLLTSRRLSSLSTNVTISTLPAERALGLS